MAHQTGTVLTTIQYQSLCDGCDRILLAKDSTDECIAIPWLHVIREHPVFLANYKQVFEDGLSWAGIKHFLLTRIKRLIYLPRILKMALFFNRNSVIDLENLPRQIDCLFVSHLLNPAQAGNSLDFYFHDCAPKLIEGGFSAAIVMLNHTNLRAQTLVASWKQGDTDGVFRFVLDDVIGLREEISMYKRMRGESRRLRKASSIESDSFMRTLLIRAADEAVTSGTGAALRVAHQMGGLVSKLKPKMIVLTHEGHAWERLVFANTRRVHPATLCVGYQHAAIFRLQHAIRRNLSQKYNPDRILATGNVGRSQLEAAGLKTSIRVLGSNRISDPKTLSSAAKVEQRSGTRACLVLPEGIASECNILFEFSIECAIRHPDINFIWRLHPIIEFSTLQRQNKKLLNLPENIIISTNNLTQDISSCIWALYRGTTAIIQTVSAGVRPIYLSRLNEMPIDPLYQLEAWKLTIIESREFSEIVDSTLPKSNSVERSAAMKYCLEYYSPFDLRQLTELIETCKPPTYYAIN